MRRHPAAVALCLFAALTGSMAAASAPDKSVDSLASECIQTRLETFVEEARQHRARLRIEVEILDDDCGQTLQMVLWRTPDGKVSAEGLLADHQSVPHEVHEIQAMHPKWPERSVCDAVSLRESVAMPSDMPKLDQQLEDLKQMLLHPVLEPLLIIHGLQYEIRIESGISQSTFSFHAPGHPRPPIEELHVLDRWSQELRHALGFGCDRDFGSTKTHPGSSEAHEKSWM